MPDIKIKDADGVYRTYEGVSEVELDTTTPGETAVFGYGAVKLASIAITTPPAKTEYVAFEAFDPTGMAVVATYTNGATREVAALCTFSPEAFAWGDTEATVIFTEGGVTATAVQAVTVEKARFAVPTLAAPLTYNGSEQTAVWSGYDAQVMIISGDTRATNAGSYAAIFALIDPVNSEWADGTTGDKTVAWSIAKATPVIAAIPASVVLDAEHLSATVTVTSDSDGALSAASGDASIAAVSLGAGGAITVSSVGQASGTTTVNVATAETANYAPGTLNIPLAAQFFSIYGVEWDGTSTTKWTRTDDSANFTDPVPYVAGATVYGSPFDTLMPWSGMVKSEDAAAGTLVAIPKFWYKLEKVGAGLKIQIADGPAEGFHVSPAHMDRGDGHGERDVVYVGRYHCSTNNYKSETGVKPKVSITRAAARTNIHNLGADIWQLDHALWWTIDMLYLVEFANPNCQGTIGYGRGNGSTTEVMGYTDMMPYHTGTMKTSKTEYGGSTQYRNIEGLWDNVVNWCDGIYFSGANIYHIIDPAMFSDNANGTLTGTRATVDSKVITGFTFPAIEGFEWAGYPGSADVGASGTTGADYFCDNEYYNANGVVLRVGGGYNQNQSSGLFSRNGGNAASVTLASVGARLQKLP